MTRILLVHRLAAALFLFAAAPAAAQGAIWWGTFAPLALLNGFSGCDSGTTETSCNAAFLPRSTDIPDGLGHIYSLSLKAGTLELVINTDPTLSFDDWTLYVGSSSFRWADGTAVGGELYTITWSNTGLTWTVGTPVRVSLEPPSPHGPPPGKPTLTLVTSGTNAQTATTLSFTVPCVSPGKAPVTDYYFWAVNQTDGSVLRHYHTVPFPCRTETVTLTGLESGMTYRVRARARNLFAREGAWSDWTEGTTLALQIGGQNPQQEVQEVQEVPEQESSPQLQVQEPEPQANGDNCASCSIVDPPGGVPDPQDLGPPPGQNDPPAQQRTAQQPQEPKPLPVEQEPPQEPEPPPDNNQHGPPQIVDQSQPAVPAQEPESQPAQLGDDARLKALALSVSALDFASTRRTYTVEVAHDVDSLTVTPTVNDPGATVEVNGESVASGQASQPIPLRFGKNRIAVEITAADGKTEQVYVLTVTRAGLEGISASPDSVREDDGQPTTITLTVTLDQAAKFGGEQVLLTLVAPTQYKTAKRGEDFAATLTDPLTIATGRIKGTAQLTLTPQDNATADGDKALAVQATLSSGHAALINIKIIDDEPADGEEVNDAIAFGFAGQVAAQAYTAGMAIAALQLPEAVGGQGEVTYRVAGLPAGLSFDASTRTISGTPEAATNGAVEVVCLAQDSTGATRTLTLSITVNPPLSFGDLFGAGGG